MTTDGLEQVRIGNSTSELKMKKKQRNVVLNNCDAVVVVKSIAPIDIYIIGVCAARPPCGHLPAHSFAQASRRWEVGPRIPQGNPYSNLYDKT